MQDKTIAQHSKGISQDWTKINMSQLINTFDKTTFIRIRKNVARLMKFNSLC